MNWAVNMVLVRLIVYDNYDSFTNDVQVCVLIE